MTTNPNEVALLSAAEVSTYSSQRLSQLQSAVNHSLAEAKRLKDIIDGAIALKYEESARAQRKRLGKDTGTVHFMDDGVRVSCDLPKKVEWDQQRLAEITQRIAEQGDDPAEYVEIAMRVSERKYSAWPDHIRQVFAPARTLNAGKPTFKLSQTARGEA